MNKEKIITELISLYKWIDYKSSDEREHAANKTIEIIELIVEEDKA